MSATRRNFLRGISGAAVAGAIAQPSHASVPAAVRPFAAGQIDLTMGQSPLVNAIDAWYTYLVNFIRPTESRRIALNNIITPLDMYDNTNFFNQYLFRTFVDRLVLTSPKDYSLGNASVTSAYSYHWSILLERAISDIDLDLSADLQNKIDEYDRQIGELREKYQKIRFELESRWTKIAEALGITPANDKYYIFKKKKYADDNYYSTQLAGVRSDIARRLTKQNQLRLQAQGTEEERVIISTYQYAVFEEHKLMLPVIPDFEKNDGLSAADLTNLAVTGAGGQFEAEIDIRPVGDLRNFFSNSGGANSIHIEVNKEYEHKHDSQWNVSAGASWPFVEASVSGESESHIKESLKKVRKITVGWANMADYFVRRGRWFNPSLLSYKRVQKVLKADPKLKAQLSRTVASLVMARGISITLEFTDSASVERWSKSTFSGSSGVNVFGVNFGSEGSSYNYDWSLEKSGEARTVTLKDDPKYARVCAFVTEEVIAGISSAEINTEFLDPSYYTPELVKTLKGS
jgi:hypothetical protein